MDRLVMERPSRNTRVMLSSETASMVCRKLFDYEDTGLTPEEIKADNEVFKAYRYVCGGKSPEEIEKALKLLDYEEQGLLIKLPCKVGDTVYVDKRILYLPYAIGCTKKIVECEVIDFIQTKKQKLIKISPHGLDCYIGRASNKRLTVSAIGKTVFLTREAAEEALKGGEGE